MRERDIENYLVSQVKRRGGMAYKWSSPSHRGVPDRLVILPKGVVIAVELKAEGKRPTKLQLFNHRLLRTLGIEVVVIDSKRKADILLRNFN
jgi:hypothetical protein